DPDRNPRTDRPDRNRATLRGHLCQNLGSRWRRLRYRIGRTLRRPGRNLRGMDRPRHPTAAIIRDATGRRTQGVTMAQSRKDDHIRLAAAQQDQLARATNAFDDVDFIHHALNGINDDAVDISAQLGPWTLPAPIYINGMTGGTDMALPINTALAQ